MNEQELNKKLAEWAGFERSNSTQIETPWDIYTLWSKPDNKFLRKPLAKGSLYRALCFTQSLDACLKWLVPLAIDKIMAEQECSSDLAYAILFKKWLQELELIIPKAALALCKAIEKLIDNERR